ncbi:MAG: carboxypeptidase M32 [Spirochaetes bacterium]|nr:carboxypeptidase M32 [Spirochaetota bacterium]
MNYQQIMKSYQLIRNLEETLALLEWDQAVYMPKRGIQSRAEKIAFLTEIIHSKYLDDDFYISLYKLYEGPDFKDFPFQKQKEIEFLIYLLVKKRKIPANLEIELARTKALAQDEWEKARETGDDREYKKLLIKIIDLKIRYANTIGYKNNPYDALLDDYDPNLKYSFIAPLFEELKGQLVEFIQKINKSSVTINTDFLNKSYDVQKQWDFGLFILEQMGIDLESFRQDYSVHPFTTNIGVFDVRITTNLKENNVMDGFFSTIHETGHALYELGVCEALEYSPCANLLSLSLHESQSRFYENIVGRSRGFWEHYFPHIQKVFPQNLEQVKVEQFYQAVNQVKLSPIRIEADEVTYNLHILLRTEVENKIINGTLKVMDLEEYWNETTKSLFDFYPASKKEGYLQDIHWSAGLFGYFPTYTLGNLISAQIYQAMQKDIPDLVNFSGDKFTKIKEWMKAKVYQMGNMYSTEELVNKISGENLKSDYFMKYLDDKYQDIYQL